MLLEVEEVFVFEEDDECDTVLTFPEQLFIIEVDERDEVQEFALQDAHLDIVEDEEVEVADNNDDEMDLHHEVEEDEVELRLQVDLTVVCDDVELTEYSSQGIRPLVDIKYSEVVSISVEIIPSIALKLTDV